MRLVKRLQPNLFGNDYIVGDIHGMYDHLQTLLAHIQFNPLRDRLISVGDLTDRGTKSVECLRLLKEPWMYSVMGNHEELLLAAAHYPDITIQCGDADILFNGGEWIRDFILQYGEEWVYGALGVYPDFKELLALVADLPQIIVIDGDVRYNIAHTNLPAYWDDEKIDSLPSKIASNFCSIGISTPSRWARDLIPTMGWVNSPDLSTTFVGHTIVEHVKRVGSYIMLETGICAAHSRSNKNIACTKYGLSIYALKSHTIYRCDIEHNCSSISAAL